MSGRLRAALELLRAPLLLSPVADVAAGFAAACASAGTLHTAAGASLAWPFEGDGSRRLALAAAVGTCLLAAGMTLNGIVDLPDDRLRKPDRPLPRGALSVRAAWWLYGALTAAALLAAAAAARDSAAVPAVALSIVLVTGLYHVGLKRHRLAGCALLGAARGLDLLLGAVAFLGRPAAGALAAAAVYALYMTGASLHASTDDEARTWPWSRVGLGLCLLALALPVAPLVAGRLAAGEASAWLAAAVALLAAGRLVHAARTRPAPAITGVALSGLYLLLASLVLAAGLPDARLPVAALLLLLFGLSRLLARAFPPS